MSSTASSDPLAPTRTPEQPGPGPLSASSLRALELSVGRRVDGQLAGDYRSAFAGVGSELWQVRPYEPGDDVRRIEWNVTARTGIPHVRVELAERVLVTWLVLDASASMAFGTGERRKADVAEGVAVAVGYAATRRGNRLGTIAFGEEAQVERPRQGRRALLETLRLLRDLPPGGNGSLRGALELADRVATQRVARDRRLGLPGSPGMAAAAAPTRWTAHRARGRGARPAGAGARGRRRAASRRSGDGTASARRHERSATARALCGGGLRRAPRALGKPGDGGRRARRAFDRGRLAAAADRVPASRAANALSFAAPLLLFSLLAVPVVVAGYLWLDVRRDDRAATWASPALLPNMVSRPSAWRRHLPAGLLLVGVALLLVGFARPKATISVKKEEATVVIVLDDSGSMASTDAPPTRLAAARAAAKRYVDKLPKGYRMSVITFSDHTTLASPPTSDLVRIRAVLDRARTGPQGTALADAVSRAVAVARQFRARRRATGRPQ